jgi:hypothetical protein
METLPVPVTVLTKGQHNIMARGVRRALRTAEYPGRQSYITSPTPSTNDQETPVSDTQPLPAQLVQPPTSDGAVIVAAPGTLPLYNTPRVLGTVNDINTTPPQILNREA